MSTEDNRNRNDSARKLATYLAGAGTVIGPAGADAAIVYFNPEPDLVAIDTDLFAVGGLQQITIDFTIEVPEGKSEQTLTGLSAIVEPASTTLGATQLVLRPDDFATTRVADAEALGGPNVRVATGPDTSSKEGDDVVANELFAVGDVIDDSADWVSTSDKSGAPSSHSAEPLDGFELLLAIGVEINPSDDKSDDYFGWLRYSSHDTAITVHDLAIELDANTPIAAGDMGSTPIPIPPTLPMLAAGAVGLAAFRRKRTPEAGCALD